MMSVHNDFHQTHAIFTLFDGLEVADIDKSVEDNVATNGDLMNGHA